MKISELRHLINMSQRSFAEYFGIPIGTLRNWEQEISNPPEYVFQMIVNSIRRDKMINVETIKFVNMLNELAELSANGIEGFSKATSENLHTKLFYDDISSDENRLFRIVLDAYINDNPECVHHDIVGCYDSYTNEYTIRAVVDEGFEPYILVHLSESGEEIEIENGSWNFVNK